MLRLKRAGVVTEEGAKQQLRRIRPVSLVEVDSWVNQLQSSLSSVPGLSVVVANDALEAVEAIARIAGDTGRIAINKSAVVTKELAPLLRDAGWQVCETYYAEFPSFQNRFSHYWQLPSLPFDRLLDSVDRPVSLMEWRSRYAYRKGVKDFIGVVGVSSVSASDGSVFIFQHANNIANIFAEAKKLIVVLTLDKIARDAQDATMLTKYMAVFGCEAVLLDMEPKPGQPFFMDNLPLEPPPPQEKLHIIILDNGRRHLWQTPYKDLFSCIGCRACMKSCPTYQFFKGDPRYSPKEYLYSFLRRDHSSIDLCLNCGMCQTCCPLDIPLPQMMLAARADQATRKGQPLADRLLGDFETVARWSSKMPSLANRVLNNRLLRTVAEQTLGISKDSAPPRFESQSFSEWFHARK